MRTLSPFFTTRGLASDFFDTEFFNEQERSYFPATEIAETDQHFMLSLDLPGMKKEDVKIEFVENQLTISGERKRGQYSEKERIQRVEKSYGQFKRSFILPKNIEADKIEARFESGVLELYLPKAQAVQPRKIEIQSGKGGFFDKLLSQKPDKAS